MDQEIMQKFNEQSEQLRDHGEQLELIARTVSEHTLRFDGIDKRLDLLTKKVLEHDDRLERIEENMATKADIREITNTLDKLVGLALKKDQELTFMGERVKRAENDILQIKPLVGLAVS